MGTLYYLVDEAKKEVLALGKAYWFPVGKHGDLVTAEKASAPVDPMYEYSEARSLILEWLEGREGVTLFRDDDGDDPPWNEVGGITDDWTGWDLTTPPTAGWRPMTVCLKAATCTEPWATLCVNGTKTLETRTGPLLSRHRGPLVIHRSLAAPSLQGLAILNRMGIPTPRRPESWLGDTRGDALGVVYVSGTFPPRMWTQLGDLCDLQRQACFEDIETRYLSTLSRAAWFPKPIPLTGHQYLFDAYIPASYLPDWAKVPTLDQSGRKGPLQKTTKTRGSR